MLNYDRMIARARNLAGGMQKKADGGMANDMIGGYATAAIPYVGGIANLGGTIHGLYKGKPTEEELEEMDRTPERSWFPGVGSYRLARKSLDAVQNDHPRATVLSEAAGSLLHSLVGGIAGGLAGAAASTRADPKVKPALISGGVAAGAVLGAAPQILGSIIGLARKRRTAREQEEADANHSILKALLVPGYAGYSGARRMASITRREDERNRRAEEKRDRNA